MQIIKIIGITLIIAIVLGFVIGKIITSYLRKKEEGRFILSKKERLISGVSVVLGAVLIIVGIVVVPKFSDNSQNVMNTEENLLTDEIYTEEYVTNDSPQLMR